MNFKVLEVPGHCPGSLCFFSRENELLIGGDVLFAAAWDAGICRAVMANCSSPGFGKNSTR